MGKNKATKAAKETRRGTDINKKAIFTVKQNYTLGVAIKDHGAPTLGTQVTITGTASGTDGLSTLGSRVLRTLGVAENVKTPRGTTLGEMKLFQPEGMGNPSPSTATFLATVKGGTSAKRAQGLDTVIAAIYESCFFNLQLTVPAQGDRNGYVIRTKIAPSGERLLVRRYGEGWRNPAVDAVNFVVEGSRWKQDFPKAYAIMAAHPEMFLMGPQDGAATDAAQKGTKGGKTAKGSKKDVAMSKDDNGEGDSEKENSEKGEEEEEDDEEDDDEQDEDEDEEEGDDDDTGDDGAEDDDDDEEDNEAEDEEDDNEDDGQQGQQKKNKATDNDVEWSEDDFGAPQTNVARKGMKKAAKTSGTKKTKKVIKVAMKISAVPDMARKKAKMGAPKRAMVPSAATRKAARKQEAGAATVKKTKTKKATRGATKRGMKK